MSDGAIMAGFDSLCENKDRGVGPLPAFRFSELKSCPSSQQLWPGSSQPERHVCTDLHQASAAGPRGPPAPAATTGPEAPEALLHVFCPSFISVEPLAETNVHFVSKKRHDSSVSGTGDV